MIESTLQIPFQAVTDADSQKIKQILTANLGSQHDRTPMTFPKTFSRADFSCLLNQNYFVHEEGDGQRCLMLLEISETQLLAYLITRKGKVHQIKQRGSLTSQDSLHNSSISVFDGRLGRTSDHTFIFTMNDMLMHKGKNIMCLMLKERLDRLKRYADEIYDQFQASETLDDGTGTSLELSLVEAEPSFNLSKFLREDATQSSLIFRRQDKSYHFGSNKNNFKWCPTGLMTIDFRLGVDCTSPNYALGASEVWPEYSDRPNIYLYAWHGYGNYEKYDELYLDPKEWDSLADEQKPLDKRIVACRRDEHDRWRLMYFRDDKQHGNYISTIRSMVSCIKEEVTKQEFLEQVDAIRSRWDMRSA